MVTGHEPGDTKVCHFYAAITQNHDVMGLDIPVNNSAAVSVSKSFHNLGNKMKCFPPGKFPSPLLHILFQGDAIDKFHNDIIRLRRAFRPGNIVNRHDVGMREHGDSLGFFMKTTTELFVLRQIIFQYFNGYKTVKPVALCLINHRHAT